MSIAEARKALEQRFPAAFARVRAASPRIKADWSAPIQSMDDFLSRWIDALALKPYSAVALSGLGDGRALSALLAAAPRGCRIYCAEPDAGVVAAFLERSDASQILLDDRLYLGVGEPDDSFFQPMSGFPVLELQDIATALFAPFFNETPEYYERFFLQFARQIEYWRKLWGTNATASGKWQGNTLANARRLLGAPDLAIMRGAFAGKDMVLASAGPSLDESLAFLRRAQRRAVVVAVNSSFGALRRAGVQPHFVLAADPSVWTDRGFEGVDLGETILICPFIVYPKVAERFEGRTMTWSGDNLLATHLRRSVGLEKGSTILEHGTVSACAFDLAALFGCRSLNLVGQDLAVREGGQSHAADTFYSEIGSNRVDVAKCRWFPGNTLEKVPVEEKLHVYLKTFEALARHRGASITLRNASRLGARIEGIPYHSLQAVLEKLSPPGDSIPKAWRKARSRCAEQAPHWESARKELDVLAAFSRSLTTAALRGALSLEIAAESSARMTVEEIEKAETALSEIKQLLQSQPAYKVLVEDGWLKFERLEHAREMRRLAVQEMGELDRRSQELLSELWCWAEGVYRFTVSVEEAMDR